MLQVSIEKLLLSFQSSQHTTTPINLTTRNNYILIFIRSSNCRLEMNQFLIYYHVQTEWQQK